jgi:hypothetical protein
MSSSLQQLLLLLVQRHNAVVSSMRHQKHSMRLNRQSSLCTVHDVHLQVNACDPSSPVSANAEPAAATEAAEGVAIPLQSAPRLTFGIAELMGLRPDMEDRAIVSMTAMTIVVLHQSLASKLSKAGGV